MLPPAAVAEALRLREAWCWPPAARPTPPADLHVTLHFLGDVDDARAQALADMQVPMDAMTLRAQRASVWGGAAVLELEPNAALARLHAQWADALRSLELRLETRAWRPHITLARNAAQALPPHKPAALEWRADSLSLVWSGGGRYEALKRWWGG